GLPAADDFVQSVVDASAAPSRTAAGPVRTVAKPTRVSAGDVLGAMLPAENLLTDLGVYTAPAAAAPRPAPGTGTRATSPAASPAARSRTPGYPYDAPARTSAASPPPPSPMGRTRIPAGAIQVASMDDDYWPGIGATGLVPGTGKPTPETEGYLS